MNRLVVPRRDDLFGFNALRIWQRNFLIWKKFFISYSMWHIAEPLMYILAVGYGMGGLIGQVDGVDYIRFFAPAMLAVTVMNTACFTTTYESFSRLKIQKVFSSTIVTPTTVADIVAGEILWAATKASLSAACVGLVLMALKIVPGLLVLASLPLGLWVGLMFAALGLLVTTLAKDYDHFTYFFTIFLSPMFLFSGTFFPLHTLPAWAQTIAWFLPLTHAVKIIREILNGHVSLTMVPPLLWMAAVTLIVYLITVRTMRRRLIH